MFLLIFLLFYINWLMAHSWRSKFGSLSLKKFLSQRTQWKWTKYVQNDKCCDQVILLNHMALRAPRHGNLSYDLLSFQYCIHFVLPLQISKNKILYITPVYHNSSQENKKTTGPCTIEIHVINRILGSCNLNTCIIKLSWNMLNCSRNVIKLSKLKNISLANFVKVYIP